MPRSEGSEIIASMMTALQFGPPSKIWDVFLLFSIPIGGGMPAGVLLAKENGMGWIAMTFLYFISDVVLALYFEPLMKLFIYASTRYKFLAHMRQAFKDSTNKTISKYGAKPGPMLLIGVAFGVDPMTGRAAAMAAGHSFLAGWTIAIIGDMIFFTIIAISTIALNGILGDGTWTAIIIMALMFGIPPLIRRFRERKAPPSVESKF